MFNQPLPQSLGGYGQLSQPAPQLAGTFGNYAFLPGGGNPYGAMTSNAMGGPAQNWGWGTPGGGGGGGNAMGGLLGQFQAASDQANNANRRRYRQALGLARANYMGDSAEYNRQQQDFTDLRQRALNRNRKMGGVARQGIADRYKQLGAQQSQDMQSRGLGNTTLVQQNQKGLQAQQERDINDLNERLRNERQGIDIGLTKDRLAMAERFRSHQPIQQQMNLLQARNDTGPDMSQLYSLMYGMGRGGA